MKRARARQAHVTVCCPGFNSAAPALSHYHTEQTACVCWVVKTLLHSVSALFFQLDNTHPPPPPPPPPLPQSPIPLSSLRVICRLHTYTADLRGSLSEAVRASFFSLCVHMCGRGRRRRRARRTMYKAFFFPLKAQAFALSRCIQKICISECVLASACVHAYVCV